MSSISVPEASRSESEGMRRAAIAGEATRPMVPDLVTDQRDPTVRNDAVAGLMARRRPPGFRPAGYRCCGLRPTGGHC